MRFSALVILALTINSAHADSKQIEQLRPILIEAITNQSTVLQLLIKCDAPEELIQKTSSTAMADLNDFKTKDSEGAAAFDKAFQDGKAKADVIYQQLGNNANSSSKCTQTIQIANIGLGF